MKTIQLTDEQYNALKSITIEPPKKGPWKPEWGQEYWCVTAVGSTSLQVYNNDQFDNGLLAFGNAFSSKENAQKASKAMRIHNKILQYIIEKDSDGEHMNIEEEPVVIGEDWKPCMKLPIVVHVRGQREGETHVSTREGITPLREDDLIMRGVDGEEYPIGRELFARTYTFDTAPPKREWVGLTDDEILLIKNWYLEEEKNS